MWPGRTAQRDIADNHRDPERPDRRVSARGGRRRTDNPKPWWMRRRVWLTVATFAWATWRRARRR